jgi:hypothetical protein
MGIRCVNKPGVRGAPHRLRQRAVSSKVSLVPSGESPAPNPPVRPVLRAGLVAQ